jgi:hypothetical protein
MERDEAIAIIRKEYLCVDRDCGIEKNCGKCDLVMPSKEPILEAYKMAIKALEHEPKWDRRYNLLNDMRLGIAPDETVTDIDERNTRLAQTDIIDEIMERLASVTQQPEEDCYTCKHRYYETWRCVRCRVRFPSHYERREEHHGSD